jgi:TPR repeat protein
VVRNSDKGRFKVNRLFNSIKVTKAFSGASIAALLLLSFAVPVKAEQLKAIQIYTQDELLTLIKHNQHLQRVKADDCQLLQDIEARATVVKIPAYQFLYGDMLAYAVCVDKDVERGIFFMRKAADQGLPEGLEQMGRYYHIGRFVQADVEQAITYLREAAAMGSLNAKIRLVEIFVKGDGSPLDYENAYRWLHHSIIADPKQHKKAAKLLLQLAKLMPSKVLKRAKRPLRS